MEVSERPGIARIEAAIFAVTGFTLGDLKRQARQRERNEARFILNHFAREAYPRATLTEMGRYLGRSHATILHYERQHRNLCETDKDYRDMVERVKDELDDNRQVDVLDMFAIFKPNGEILPDSIRSSVCEAWYRGHHTLPSDVKTQEEIGWQCRPVKVTVTSTKP